MSVNNYNEAKHRLMAKFVNRILSQGEERNKCIKHHNRKGNRNNNSKSNYNDDKIHWRRNVK